MGRGSIQALGLAVCVSATGCYDGMQGRRSEYDLVSDFRESFRPNASRELREIEFEGEMLQYEVVDGEVAVEGDILFGPVDVFEGADEDAQFRGVGKDFGRWSMPIRYQFEGSTSPATRTAIGKALKQLVDESGAKLKFEACEGSCRGSKIIFQFDQGGGCAADAGRQWWPWSNRVMLDEYCDGVSGSAAGRQRELGVIMHEVMHALGVWHEQSRCDRDDYVFVDYDEIKSAHASNFSRRCLFATDYGSYDYGSIMHYSATAFSRDGNPTLIPVDDDGEDQMGNRSHLSRGDRSVLQGMYGRRD